MTRRPLLVAAAVLALACDGGPSGPPAPVPGFLVVRLASPNVNDAAMLVRVTGPGALDSVLIAGPGLLLHARASGGTMRAAVFGALASGIVVEFAVPDVNQAASYTATILEVADQTNNLRASLAGYSVSVER